MSELLSFRQHQYAVHVLALGEGSVVGAASLFDTAITNGLLAIMVDASGKAVRTPSAAYLLKQAKALPSDQLGDWASDLDQLEQVLVPTQLTRHGRLGGIDAVPSVAIDALRKLDSHPNLGVLLDQQIDQAEVNTVKAIAQEQERALRYMELIGEEETEIRAARAHQALPFDPAERYTSPGLGECPMCNHESLVVHYESEWGSQAGTCFACSYVVSRNEAERNDLFQALQWHQDK